VHSGALGSAVIWGTAHGCERVNLIVDEGGGDLAHAATMFAEPAPQIWRAHEREIHLVEPVVPKIERPPECLDYNVVLAEAGLDIVADHGVWLGEINGLEVARVGLRDGKCSIDIGVGAYDQFASAALNVDRDAATELAMVVDMVRPHRTAGAAPHPMGRIVRARWLRTQIIRQPDLIGLDSINPIPLLHERPGLMEAQPAAAIGRRGNETVLVVCSVGLDLGVAETAAGLAAYLCGDDTIHSIDEVIVAVPTRDRYQRIVDSVAGLALPSSVLAVEGEWSD